MASTNSEALAELAGTLGIELAFDNDDACELLIDDDAVVIIAGDPEASALRLSATIGDLEDPMNPYALQTLLQANFNGQGVGAAALSMDHVTLEIVLTQAVVVAALGADGLASVLESFVNYLTFWRKNLGKLAAAEGVEETPTAAFGAVRV